MTKKKRSPSEIFQEITSVKTQRSELDMTLAALKIELSEQIPVGTTKDGVRHGIRVGKSISWAKAASDIVDKLVPKTKRAAADKLVAKYTKSTESHLFTKA